MGMYRQENVGHETEKEMQSNVNREGNEWQCKME